MGPLLLEKRRGEWPVIGGGRMADARRCSGLANGPERGLNRSGSNLTRFAARGNDASSEKMHRYKIWQLYIIFSRWEKTCGSRQTQIRVTNLDDRLIIERKIRKHGNMLPITRYHLRSVKVRQDKRVNKLVGKSTRRTLWERVHIFEIASTTEVSTLEKFTCADRRYWLFYKF